MAPLVDDNAFSKESVPRHSDNDLNTDRKRSSSPVEEQGVSNGFVLGVAFYSFLGFTVVQTGYAIKARSSAMLADSEAMFVDAGTYLFNMLAEKLKDREYTETELALPLNVRLHGRKLQRLYLELVPPLISVVTLLVVTFTTLRTSIVKLLSDEQVEDPNLSIMLFFSALNLVLDAVNVSCFAQANQAILTPMNFDKELPANEKTPLKESATILSETQVSTLVDEDELSDDGLINLNMCSAWTHVFADTLRSVAVLIAAGIAYVSEFITAGEADAYAALVVSFIILLSCGPLIQGLCYTAREIRAMHQGQVPNFIMSV